MAGNPFRPAGRRNSAVLARLAGLWDQAAGCPAASGELTQKLLAAESGVPLSTVNSWATGASLPQDSDRLAAVGTALARRAAQEPPGPREWSRLLEADQAARGTAGTGLGHLVAELTDPFALEVHRPVEVDGPAGAGLPALPPYIPRDHDTTLAEAVGRAAAGRSVTAVLVGGSSTGKTRACWEALGLLPAGWRLWHPFDPSRPEAALAELPRIGPRTVIWLNDTQLYLDTPGDTGERVAAALRTLLADSGRSPMLVLGTLWPGHWDHLTQPGRDRAQARALLEGKDIPVPDAFTGTQLQHLRRAAGDPRLAAAAAAARDGQVTQYLAGVPELLARYRHAQPAARALIHAAMDARRLGHSIALPHALLEDAAAACLSDAEWDSLDEDWLEQALAWATRRCRGVPGPLTRIRPRPGGPAPRLQAGRSQEQRGPAYRLADYLDQHGRTHRSDQIPPPGFWAAAARHAHPADQPELADAARGRGLYREAAQLRKNAASHGDPYAAAKLVDDLHQLHPADCRPVHWAVARVSLDDPAGVVRLLDSLRAAGADQQVAELAARAVTGVALDNPGGVAELLDVLREVGADQQATELAARNPAARASLDVPYDVGGLIDSLRKMGADQQATDLAARAVGVSLDHPFGVGPLLHSLRGVGTDQQAAQLAARAAAGVALDDSHGVVMLLHFLREAGEDQQATQLAVRIIVDSDSRDDPGSVARLVDSLREPDANKRAVKLACWDADRASLDDPGGVARVLDSLQKAGADQRAIELGGWAAGGVSLDDLGGVVSLLGSLRMTGAADQVTELAARAAAGVALDDPGGVGELLDSLRGVGADQQAAQLAARAAAGVALDALGGLDYMSRLGGTIKLLGSLRAAGADRQIAELAARLPTAGMFHLHPDHDSSRYRFGRELGGHPAPAWDWADLD